MRRSALAVALVGCGGAHKQEAMRIGAQRDEERVDKEKRIGPETPIEEEDNMRIGPPVDDGLGDEPIDDNEEDMRIGPPADDLKPGDEP